jgi:multiple sugar transport system substrate-binding protein
VPVRDFAHYRVQVELGASKANWDVGVMPKINEPATLLFGEALVMSSNSKHPKEAWEFYKWMVDPNSVLELYSSGLWMPIVKDWYEKPELVAKWAEVKPGHTANYKTAVMDMVTQHGVNADDYYLKNAPKIYAVLTPALDPVWVGKQTAADALKGVESKLQPLFQGVYTKR